MTEYLYEKLSRYKTKRITCLRFQPFFISLKFFILLDGIFIKDGVKEYLYGHTISEREGVIQNVCRMFVTSHKKVRLLYCVIC